MLAVSFAVADVSVFSALSVVRIAYVLNVALVFLLAFKLFRPASALSAVVLYLASGITFFTSTRVLPDNILPSFLLAGFWLLAVALKSRSSWIAILAGASFSLAYLTKELTLLFMPFPLLVLLTSGKLRRDRQAWKTVFLTYVAFAVVSVPWVILVLQNGHIWDLAGAGIRHLDRLGDVPAGEAVFSVSAAIFARLQNYVESSFYQTTGLPG